MKKYIFILFYLNLLVAQNLVLKTIPLKFDFNQIEVDDENSIYLLSNSKNKLVKYIKSTNYDSTFSVGGRGIGLEGFNQISNLFLANKMSIYVYDGGNKRLLVLNQNFKTIGQIDFMAENSNVDVGCYFVNNMAELFILNQNNNTILKYNNLGKIETTFSGNDWGEASLIDPISIFSNEIGMIQVVDLQENELILKKFSHTGNFISIQNISIQKDFLKIKNTNKFLLLIYENLIEIFSQDFKKLKSINIKDKIIDASFSDSYLYILKEKSIEIMNMD